MEYKPINFQPVRNVTRISDDFCAINQKEKESQKPLKFVTTTFNDFNDRHELRGINFHDGNGIQGCSVDVYNKLTKQVNTNPNLPQSLPGLPLPTTGSHAGGQGQGDVDTEFMLRGKDTNGSKVCLPFDENYHNRSFANFDALCRKPQELKHTVQKTHGYRGGVSTRIFNCK